jgi:hypothetical protein
MKYSEYDEIDAQTASEELNDNKENRDEKIAELRLLCENSQKIKKCCLERLDDQFIVSTLEVFAQILVKSTTMNFTIC